MIHANAHNQQEGTLPQTQPTYTPHIVYADKIAKCRLGVPGERSEATRWMLTGLCE
jgi:hypothetical protein